MTDLNQHECGDGSAANPKRRITSFAARQMLGMLGRNYADDDLVEILDTLYGIAEEGFEIYREIGSAAEHGNDQLDGSDE